MRVSVLDLAGRLVYYPYMASIVGKKRGNQRYYYLVESARVDGKPRIVAQEYLGSAQEVMDRLSAAAPGRPERTQHKAFGGLAAVWGILDRLGVAGAIDEVCGSRRSDAGASVGTYLALATMNRVVAPCSKLGFEQWWATTAGPRFPQVPVAATDHRRFWDAMDNLDTAKLAAAEAKIATTMVSQFGLDLSGLALDMTNFATFIDSANDRAPIAKRGHAKQKRNDLRLVGLALVVPRDGAIPVPSHAYPGNRPDVTQFGAVLDELTSRYAALFDTHGAAGPQDKDKAPSGPTVVFDAGQNSAANFAHLTGAGLHYVGSLPPSSFPDLLAVPARRRHPVDPDTYPGLSAYDTRAMVVGADRRVVLTHSANPPPQHAPGTERARRAPGPRQDPPPTRRRPSRGSPDHPPALGRPGADHPAHRDHCRHDAAHLADRPRRPQGPGNRDLRQTPPGHRPRPLGCSRGRRRLPLPKRRRVRVPPAQRPPRRRVLTHVPLDRVQDPSPRLLLRPSPGRRPPHAPTSPPRRAGPQRPAAPDQPRRHPRNRPALPHREQRPSPRPTHPHRHRPHPETPLRHLRTRHLRPTALTWVIHPATPKTGPDLHVYH